MITKTQDGFKFSHGTETAIKSTEICKIFNIVEVAKSEICNCFNEMF